MRFRKVAIPLWFKWANKDRDAARFFKLHLEVMQNPGVAILKRLTTLRATSLIFRCAMANPRNGAFRYCRERVSVPPVARTGLWDGHRCRRPFAASLGRHLVW